MTPEQHLLDTIEQIRMERFPEVPAGMVKRIVMAERDHADNRQLAYKIVSSVIDEYLQKDPMTPKVGT